MFSFLSLALSGIPAITATNENETNLSLFDSGYSPEAMTLLPSISPIENKDLLQKIKEESIDPSKTGIISLSDCLAKAEDNIKYTACKKQAPFNFEPFPLSVAEKFQPHQGSFNETFILTIKNGRVCTSAGWVIINNNLIQELIWKNKQLGLKHFQNTAFENVKKITGRVAVITQRGDTCYFHWITEVLGRLALLEMSGIEYDWLYVSTKKPFMKESLALWGVDLNKIIEPTDDTIYIEAEELIVPSLVSKVSVGYTRFASYVPDYVINYIQQKLSLLAEKQLAISHSFSKRIFISRKDSVVRQTINEDEVFELFKAKGFERYNLSDLSFIEQIELFQHAEMIVGTHGAGLTNTIFCKPGTLVIELFQARGSATYWYISQMLGLRHLCVKTTEFDTLKNGFLDTEISLSIIEEIVREL